MGEDNRVTQDIAEGKEFDPVVLMEGRFRLYETSEGGYHLVYRVDDTDEDKHIKMPAGMVKAAKAMSEGKGRLSSVIGKR